MTASTWIVAATMGAGVALVTRWWWDRAPSFEARIAPLLRIPSGGATATGAPGASRYPRVERVLGRRLASAVRFASRVGSSPSDVVSRLRRAGSALTIEQYRAEQVVWGLAGLAVGLVLAVGLGISRGSSPVALVGLIIAFACAGAVGREYALGRAVARREARILAELPTLAEMLALCVNAGEGISSAIDRISRIAAGALADEFRVVLGSMRAGTPLADALRDLADGTRVAELRRFADGIAIAVERGTPLADLLHAQATDIREAGRRRLIEEGGKREIAMMVPVVFMILPVTVVFAVFPGIVAINLGL